MKIERDERKFDFHGIGLAIKKAREREGMTQEQLGYIVDRDPRTIMYHENDGQHPSLNAFYQMVTMFGISVDEYFYPDMSADEAANGGSVRKAAVLKYDISKPPLDFSTQNRHRTAVSCVRIAFSFQPTFRSIQFRIWLSILK